MGIPMKNNQYVQWIRVVEGKPTPKVGRGIPPPGTNMAIAIEHPPIFWLDLKFACVSHTMNEDVF